MRTLQIKLDSCYQNYFEEVTLAKANKKLARINQPSLNIVSIDRNAYEIRGDYGRKTTIVELTYNIETPDITGIENIEYVSYL